MEYFKEINKDPEEDSSTGTILPYEDMMHLYGYF